MACRGCGGMFRTGEDYRDHLPCSGSAEDVAARARAPSKSFIERGCDALSALVESYPKSEQPLGVILIALSSDNKLSVRVQGLTLEEEKRIVQFMCDNPPKEGEGDFYIADVD